MLRDAGVAESEKLDTVTVRVAGALAAPRSSVTVNDAVEAPGVAYVTPTGPDDVLAEGEPPGKLHAYDAMVPSESAPWPENETVWPGFTVTFPAGLVIVATGGVFPTPMRTKVAADGTPDELSTNNMYEPGGAMFPFGGAVTLSTPAPTVNDRPTIR